MASILEKPFKKSLLYKANQADKLSKNLIFAGSVCLATGVVNIVLVLPDVIRSSSNIGRMMPRYVAVFEARDELKYAMKGIGFCFAISSFILSVIMLDRTMKLKSNAGGLRWSVLVLSVAAVCVSLPVSTYTVASACLLMPLGGTLAFLGGRKVRSATYFQKLLTTAQLNESQTSVLADSQFSVLNHNDISSQTSQETIC